MVHETTELAKTLATLELGQVEQVWNSVDKSPVMIGAKPVCNNELPQLQSIQPAAGEGVPEGAALANAGAPASAKSQRKTGSLSQPMAQVVAEQDGFAEFGLDGLNAPLALTKSPLLPIVTTECARLTRAISAKRSRLDRTDGLQLVIQQKGTECFGKNVVGELQENQSGLLLGNEGIVVPDSLLPMYAPTGKGKTMLKIGIGYLDVIEPGAQERAASVVVPV